MSSDDEMIQLKMQCVELLFGCPPERSDPTCPFRMVRELDVVERVKWLKGLGMEELRRVVARHGECRQRGKENLSLRPET